MLHLDDKSDLSDFPFASMFLYVWGWERLDSQLGRINDIIEESKSIKSGGTCREVACERYIVMSGLFQSKCWYIKERCGHGGNLPHRVWGIARKNFWG